MKETSLYNYYMEKMAEGNLQQNYNLASFPAAYRTDSFNEREIEPVKHRIECGITQCRLTDDSGTIPAEIERCG